MIKTIINRLKKKPEAKPRRKQSFYNFMKESEVSRKLTSKSFVNYKPQRETHRKFLVDGTHYWENIASESPYSFALTKKERLRSTVIMGLEWEFTRNVFRDTNFIKELYKDSCLLEYANVRSENDLEFVTIPASLNLHKTILKKEVFDKGFHEKINAGHEDGIHVHISRKNFKKHRSIFSVAWLLSLNSNFEFMCFVANRNYTENRYCKAISLSTLKESNASSRSVPSINESKGYCLGFNSSNTFEIRIFNSTTDQKTLFSYLEFCELVTRWANTFEWEDGKTPSDVTKTHHYSKFISFVRKATRTKLGAKKYENFLNVLNEWESSKGKHNNAHIANTAYTSRLRK